MKSQFEFEIILIKLGGLDRRLGGQVVRRRSRKPKIQGSIPCRGKFFSLSLIPVISLRFSSLFLSLWSTNFYFLSLALFFFFLNPLWTFFCSMEFSPDLTPSFQLYICLQIGSKDASLPVPVAFSSLHCDRCMCVGGVERERGGREERESVCVYVCVCVDGFIVECPQPPTPPPSVYLVLRAND